MRLSMCLSQIKAYSQTHRMMRVMACSTMQHVLSELVVVSVTASSAVIKSGREAMGKRMKAVAPIIDVADRLVRTACMPLHRRRS